MKLYEEAGMETVREAFEAEVLSWPGVSTRKMFGCPSYTVGGSLFAFLVNDGIVLTALTPHQREALARTKNVAPFEPGGKRLPSWSRVAVPGLEEVKALLPVVRKSYEGARSSSGG